MGVAVGQPLWQAASLPPLEEIPPGDWVASTVHAWRPTRLSQRSLPNQALRGAGEGVMLPLFLSLVVHYRWQGGLRVCRRRVLKRLRRRMALHPAEVLVVSFSHTVKARSSWVERRGRLTGFCSIKTRYYYQWLQSGGRLILDEHRYTGYCILARGRPLR